jgi:PEGA domain/PKD domain
MMKRPSPRICIIVLSVLVACTVLVPLVSAEPASVTTKATVPPVLQACSHARYPKAVFTCGFPGNESPVIPEGPPYTVRCFDNSSSEPDQPIVSWRWEFGDGGISTDQHPKHIYSEALLYDVRLTVSTWCGSKYSDTANESVPVYCSVPKPEFETNVSEGSAPLAVQLTDTSWKTRQDITTWTYWFDDTHFSHERNPVFVYTTPGTYTINQTVWKDCVRVMSSPFPPFARQIIVYPTGYQVPAANGTATAPGTTPAGEVPVATTPAVTPGVPVVVTATETAQTIPLAPGTGSLSVITEPAGAQVYVDDVLRGTSPATVQDLSPGSHTLRLERDGYQRMSIPFLINDGVTTDLATTLMPVPGGIAIVPVIALSVIVLGIVVGGIYLFMRHRKE